MPLRSALLACAALSALGCTDYLVKTATNQYKMSARNLDHSSTLEQRLRGIKAGTQVSLYQVCATCPVQKLTTKYDVVGFTVLVDYDFAFWDGINSEGLGGGFLADGGIRDPPAWNPAGPKAGIPWGFAFAYVLANFKTVPEVMAALGPTKFQFTQLYIGTTYVPFPPFHMAIHDALGNSAVIELAESNAAPGTPVYSVLLNNDLHTMANNPNLPYHKEAFDYFVGNQNLVPEYIPSDLQQKYPDPAVYEIALKAFTNVPGDFSSISRFIRLALFREFQAQGDWPTYLTWELGKVPMSAEPWSPNYGENQWLNTFVMAANGVMHNVEIQGYSDQGLKLNPNLMNNPFDASATPGLDQTFATVIRDHTTRQYFWISLRAQRWQSYDLKTMTQSFFACQTPLPVVATNILDRSAQLNSLASGSTTGVFITATGTVSLSKCDNPQCPSVVRRNKGTIGIKCRCDGKFNVGPDGCGPPPTKAQVMQMINALKGNGTMPMPPPVREASMTVVVTDCNRLTPQQCCNLFASAVNKKQTPLPSNAVISCIQSDGATLAPEGDRRDGRD